MAEPDNLILEHLRAIRAKLDQQDQRLEGIGQNVEAIEIKLDGLTHAVIAGFGSLVHELDDLKGRMGRIEAERA